MTMYSIRKFRIILLILTISLPTDLKIFNRKAAIMKTEMKNNRIVGGHRCFIKKHSYMVSIRRSIDNSHNCGGSLVSRFWVLTAAHCCPNVYKRGKLKAVVGVSKTTQKGKSSLVYQCYRHENYNSFKLHNDIALLNLEFPIEESRSVSYVKLPQDTDVEVDLEEICSKSLVLGWGDQYAKNIHRKPLSTPIPKHDPSLQCVILPVVSHRHCEIKYKYTIPDTIICAFSKNQDACQGDSGGPLICDGVQYGIISSGYGCSYKDIPGKYTRVDKYQSFIRSTIIRNCASRFKLKLIHIWYIFCLALNL